MLSISVGFIDNMTICVEGRSACQLVQCLRRRSSWLGQVLVSVVEDFFDGVALGDESEDFHLAAALGTGQGVDFVGNGR